ncbi:MBL fold metallo-hydrolase [uncultured Pelagimonas sp.]|uniref:MBL fold metallo-hydrolase n=1 Tax=uncultured Pelagimonas sp. TaxID=1618102 RepID=UPI00261B5322|nr:MBL fold metallo-hydrolase [uncultured Pelagimonas sp.]
MNRREFLARSTAVGAISVIPFAGRADGHSVDMFSSAAGDIKVHPVAHASIVLETPTGVIYVDPVGEASLYADMPKPDLILVTHEHGDHLNAETLTAISGEATPIVTNAGAHAKMTPAQQGNATILANGDSNDTFGPKIEAIPAYNLTEERLKFHPQGRDNGYVLSWDGSRIYISGDTEDIPEMRALENIDLAFVCMNLPFTMDVAAAADAVAEFAPKNVYPYHYRGRDDGTQDPQAFADLIGDKAVVKMGNWYG